VLPTDDVELLDQAWLRDRREHRHSIFRALAGTDQNLIRRQTHILDAQLRGFEQSQTGSVDKM
jgi:hypothetical protein